VRRRVVRWFRRPRLLDADAAADMVARENSQSRSIAPSGEGEGLMAAAVTAGDPIESWALSFRMTFLLPCGRKPLYSLVLRETVARHCWRAQNQNAPPDDRVLRHRSSGIGHITHDIR
jgi:hypothetical protein